MGAPTIAGEGFKSEQGGSAPWPSHFNHWAALQISFIPAFWKTTADTFQGPTHKKKNRKSVRTAPE